MGCNSRWPTRVRDLANRRGSRKELSTVSFLFAFCSHLCYLLDVEERSHVTLP